MYSKFDLFALLVIITNVIFRVGQYLWRPERRKWTSKTFFLSCKTGVVRISNCRNGWVFILRKSQTPLSNIPRRSIGALEMD